MRSLYRDNIVLLADKNATFSYDYSCDSTFHRVKIGLSTMKDANARDRQQMRTRRPKEIQYYDTSHSTCLGILRSFILCSLLCLCASLVSRRNNQNLAARNSVPGCQRIYIVYKNG